ncbi:MAG: hypothetical protein PHY73_07625 [Candidatus Omnitrophica bacterium]|nr:hypothetical protein [Candidatus Omnitrophota bacterium]
MEIPNVYIAAIFTTAIALAVIGGFIAALLKGRTKTAVWLGLISLPEFVIVFYLIRVPVDKLLQFIFAVPASGGAIPFAYSLISFFYAPVTEELIKISPFLIPFFRQQLKTTNKIAVGMTIGLGFGISEMWTIAFWLSHNALISRLHWHQLGGYIEERFVACLLHGMFTIIAIQGINKKLLKYVLYTMGLHALVNLPIFLFGIGVFQADKNTAAHVLFLYPILSAITLGILLVKRYKFLK